MIKDFTFGQWLPDQPSLNNPGLVFVQNALPMANCYEPMRAPVQTDGAVPDDASGATRVVLPDGSQLIAIGTSTDLYTIQTGSVQASGLALVGAGPWSFASFGRQLWAFSQGKTPHYIPDVVTGTVFVPHPGIAPKAATAARVDDFVIAGNMLDIDGSSDPYRIRWSRFNDPAGDWTDDITYQSGAVAMPFQYGPVIAIAGGDIGIIMQRYGVSRIDYTGGATIFAKVDIAEGRGCASQASVVQVAGITYFLSDDGFFKTDGAGITSISTQRVFDFFQDAVMPSKYGQVQGAVDWASRCIIWSFASASGSGQHDSQMIYSWEADRWSYARIAVDWIFDTIKTGMSLEQVSAAYPNLDTVPASLDSWAWKDRGRSLSALIGGKMHSLTGDALEATFETGEMQPVSGRRTNVSGVAVLIENQDCNSSVQLGARETFKGGNVRWTALRKEGPDGFARPNIDGRFVRARIVVPAGAVWQRAAGITVDYVPSGRV